MNKVITASAVTLVILMTACGYDNDTLTEVTVEAPEQCKPGNGHAYGHYKDAGVGIEDAGVAEDEGCP